MDRTKRWIPSRQWVWAGAMAALLASAGGAPAGEQYLMYYSGSPSQQSLLAVTARELTVAQSPPPGLVMPPGLEGPLVVAAWATPMVPAGQVWLAVGASKAGGPYDRMVIDANANGRLDDDPPIAATDLRVFQQLQSCVFPQARLVLPSADGPVTYHLDVIFRKTGQAPRLQVRPACWYQGELDVNGQAVSCLLLDSNANGTFNDVAQDPRQSDYLKLGDSPLGRVGRYVMIGGDIHALRVSQDGSGVSLAPAGELVTGQVRADGVSSFTAAGANGVFHCQVQDGLGRLPAGEYQLFGWQIDRTFKGKPLQVVASLDKPITFEVASDAPAVLDLGEPLGSTASVQATPDGGYQIGDPRLLGRHGERITVMIDGQPPRDPPALSVTNADGSFTKQLSFAYG